MPKDTQESEPASEPRFTKAFGPKNLRIKKKSYGKKVEEKIPKFLLYRKYEYVSPITQGKRTKRYKDIRLAVEGHIEWNTKEEAKAAKESYLKEHQTEIFPIPEVEAEKEMTGEDNPTSITPN